MLNLPSMSRSHHRVSLKVRILASAGLAVLIALIWSALHQTEVDPPLAKVPNRHLEGGRPGGPAAIAAAVGDREPGVRPAIVTEFDEREGTEIIGRLEDSDGLAIPNADVRGYPVRGGGRSDPEARRQNAVGTGDVRQVSDANGQFRLRGLPQGPVAIAIRLDGYSSSTVFSFLRSPHDRRDLGAIVLPSVGTVEILVNDESGRPVETAAIMAAHGLDPTTGWAGPDSQFQVVGSTDVDERCTLSELRSGPTRIQVQADGYRPATREVDASQAAVTKLEITLASGLYIDGRVQPSDFAIDGSHLVRCEFVEAATIMDVLGPEVMSSSCGPDGTFRLGPFPLTLGSEDCVLTLDGPGGYAEQLKEPVVAAPGDAGIVLQLENGAYAHVAIESSRRPQFSQLGHATLEMFLADGQYSYESKIVPDRDRSDETKLVFRVPSGMPPTLSYRLDLRFQCGVGYYSGSFRPITGQTVDAGLAYVGPPRGTTLRIVASDSGVPIPGASVFVYPAALGDEPFAQVTRAGRPGSGGSYVPIVSEGLSSSDGTVRLACPSEAPLEMLIHSPDYVPLVIPLDPLGSGEREVRLQRGATVCFRILDGSEPIEHCAINQVSIPAGYPQARLRQCHRELVGWSPDAGGYVTFRGLTRGDYRFELIGTPFRQVAIEVDGVESLYQEIQF